MYFREQRDNKTVAASSQLDLHQTSILQLSQQLQESGANVEALRSEQEDLLVMLSDQVRLPFMACTGMRWRDVCHLHTFGALFKIRLRASLEIRAPKEWILPLVLA